MRNRISNTVTGRIFQSERAKAGVLANLVPLGYSPAQGIAFGTQIDDAIAARDLHASAKVVLDSERTAYDLAIKTTRADVMTARDVLKPILGRGHSPAWIAAGFATRLAVSNKAADILQNVQGLKAYFTAHPTHENEPLDINAARFDTLATDLVARIAAVDAAGATVITLAKARDAKSKLLNQELRTLLSKLRVSFDPFAAMWETVGFNRPGFVSVPAVPSKLSAVLMGTSAQIKWKASERAESYRVWMKVLGVDLDFVLVDSRDALDFMLEGLPAGKTIEVVVSAVNSGGESARSEVVTIVTV